MRRGSSLWLVLCIAAPIWSIASAARAAEFFVDPAAATSGDGSSGSPWQTLEQVVAAGAFGATIKAGDTVWLLIGLPWRLRRQEWRLHAPDHHCGSGGTEAGAQPRVVRLDQGLGPRGSVHQPVVRGDARRFHLGHDRHVERAGHGQGLSAFQCRGRQHLGRDRVDKLRIERRLGPRQRRDDQRKRHHERALRHQRRRRRCAHRR